MGNNGSSTSIIVRKGYTSDLNQNRVLTKNVLTGLCQSL